MIYLDSRYADGTLIKVNDSRTKTYELSVNRSWPTKTTPFFLYVWDDTDRLDIIAKRYLGNSSFWWKIMDINPEISHALLISPGTKIRIPNE